MMRRLVYCLVVLAVFSCPPKISAAGSEFPRLEIRETSFDFKEAFQGEKVSHDFVVRNAGKAVLNIKEVRRG